MGEEIKTHEISIDEAIDYLFNKMPETEYEAVIFSMAISALHRVQRRAQPDNPPLTLERFEKVCEAVHNGWWEECKRQGRENHPDMIPYEQLSESVKDYDRVTVRRVLDALNVSYVRKPEPPKEGAEKE